MIQRFQRGDRVHVLDHSPPGHIRTPSFIRGKAGVVDSIAGHYPNPEELAYGRNGKPDLTLYRVRFRQRDLWADYGGPDADTTVVDVYDHWLTPLSASDTPSPDN